MRLHDTYFGIISLVIAVTLVLPQFFGFTYISQWGGMYTDSWCTGMLYGEDPDGEGESPKPERWVIVGSDPATQMVWYAPQFNPRLCAAWLRTWCGRPSPDGWLVRESYANLRRRELHDGRNLCDEPSDGSEDWFQPLT